MDLGFSDADDTMRSRAEADFDGIQTIPCELIGRGLTGLPHVGFTQRHAHGTACNPPRGGHQRRSRAGAAIPSPAVPITIIGGGLQPKSDENVPRICFVRFSRFVMFSSLTGRYWREIRGNTKEAESRYK